MGRDLRLFVGSTRIGEARIMGNGGFAFMEQPPGEKHSVREVNPGWMHFPSTADEVTVSLPNGQDEQVDFGDWDGFGTWLPMVVG